MDLLNAGNALANPVRQFADCLYPLLAKLVHPALQLRNDVALDRIERDCGGAEDRILHEHEDQNGQQRAALKSRQGDRIADEAAKRLDLGGDHRNHFALTDFFEMRQREAQDPGIKVVAQTPQHALAKLAAKDVDIVFEAPIDADEGEEDYAQQQQVRDLVELIPEQVTGKVFSADGLVDDGFWKVERIIEKRERESGQYKKEDLFFLAVPEDEPENRRFHAVRQPMQVGDVGKNRLCAKQ